MTADGFRDVALTLHDVVEQAHMGHPDFRVNGRIFASLDAKGEWGVVKLTPEEQSELSRLQPKTFVPAAGAWGRQGWTKINLAIAEEAEVRAIVLVAWETMAAQPPAKKAAASKRPGSGAARRPTRARKR
jgi:YjbR